jgi:hypothetical protein
MYSYKEERPRLFTEDGQVMFLSVRDNVKRLLNQAGAVRMDRAISGQTGSSWEMLACVDRLVELGELREVTGADTCEQYRVFVATGGQ